MEIKTSDQQKNAAGTTHELSPTTSSRRQVHRNSSKLVIKCWIMDNCFTGQRDRSRQTSEKDILYIIPAGPARRVHSQVAHHTSSSCLDRVTS